MNTFKDKFVYSTTNYGQFQLRKKDYFISDRQYEKFKESIRLNGLLCPIIIDQNVVVDGLIRLKICQELNIPVQFIYLKDSL